MSTKIGLISDVHATVAPLKQALQIFEENGVDQVLCAGDIAGYGNQLNATIDLLINGHCLAICGNHDRWLLRSCDLELKSTSRDYLAALAKTVELNIEGKQIFMVHAHPPQFDRGGIKLLDMQGDVSSQQKQFWSQELAKFNYDVLIVGHTHQLFAEKIAEILVINPGSSCFNHSCAILQLPEMSVEFYPLSGKSYAKVWNWGKFLTE